jgi:hypothetical protein
MGETFFYELACTLISTLKNRHIWCSCKSLLRDLVSWVMLDKIVSAKLNSAKCRGVCDISSELLPAASSDLTHFGTRPWLLCRCLYPFGHADTYATHAKLVCALCATRPSPHIAHSALHHHHPVAESQPNLRNVLNEAPPEQRTMCLFPSTCRLAITLPQAPRHSPTALAMRCFPTAV